MTKEKLFEYIEDENYLVQCEGDFIFEYVEAGYQLQSGYVWENDNLIGGDGNEYLITDDLFDIIKVYKYTEIEVTLENVIKAIKEGETKDQPMIVAFIDWGFINNDLREEVSDNGLSNITDIVRLRKVKT